jgi:hypothetical protein
MSQHFADGRAEDVKDLQKTPAVFRKCEQKGSDHLAGAQAQRWRRLLASKIELLRGGPYCIVRATPQHATFRPRSRPSKSRVERQFVEASLPPRPESKG